MGTVTAGIPQEIVVQLAKLNNAAVFIETGTLHGGTTKWASNHFEFVHTIERAESLFRQHINELSAIEGVTPHLGDSREKLPTILKDIGDRKAVFWLDGHWSGGDTAGEDDECPIMGELAAIEGRNEDIILIDDARLFLAAPPLPHDPAQWPGLVDIITAIQAGDRKSFLQIINDVIFIVPDREELKNCLIYYSRQHSNDPWNSSKKKKSYFKIFRKYIKHLILNKKKK